MFRTFTALTAMAVLASVAPAADSPLADGHWRLARIQTGGLETPVGVVKVENKDGKVQPTLVFPLPLKDQKGNEVVNVEIGEIKAAGNTVEIAVTQFRRKYVFQGTRDPKEPKLYRGSLGSDGIEARAVFVSQDGAAFALPKAAKMPDPMQQVADLMRETARLQGLASRSKDVNERAEVLEKLRAARKDTDAKMPGLYREVIEKHATTPFAVDAARALIALVGRLKPDAKEVSEWMTLVDVDAQKYGPRFTAYSRLTTAETLAPNKAYGSIILSTAEKVVADLKDDAPLATQSRALKLLAAAQAGAGKVDPAIATRLTAVEKKLDDEYNKTVPPFKPTKFEVKSGAGSKNVVVMELFTGAQCPPCVAADVAFDALESTYSHTDVILIQYHMHIPGPDPLTNPASLARWDYYQKKRPGKVGGTPSTIFNGQVLAGGGGGMANAESKYTQFRGVIESMLAGEAPEAKGAEKPRSVGKLTGNAKKSGDQVMVDVSVDAAEYGPEVRLRVLLLEEKVKYVGGNALRFHHNVVRATPDATGDLVEAKGLKKSYTMSLPTVRQELTKYLDGYAAERPFPNADRPMDLAHLKAVAFLQDDATGEIIGAVQMDVAGK